jgi:hypothetical protein
MVVTVRSLDLYQYVQSKHAQKFKSKTNNLLYWMSESYIFRDAMIMYLFAVYRYCVI